MPKIHAFNRKAVYATRIGSKNYRFEPDAAGDVVCDVPDGSPAAARFLSIKDAFRLHEATLALRAAETDEDLAPLTPPENTPFIVTLPGGKTVDLRAMERPELLQLMEDGDMPAPPPTANKELLRRRIVEFLSGK